MKASGQLNSPVVLPLWTSRLSNELEAGLAAEPAWNLWRREIELRFVGCSARSPVTVPKDLQRLQ